MSCGFLLESRRLHFSLDRSMEIGLNQTDLGKFHSRTYDNNPLWNAKGIDGTLSALAFGESRPLLEEVDIGSLPVFENLLESLGVTLCKEGKLRLFPRAAHVTIFHPHS